jgi:hypothetical protein
VKATVKEKEEGLKISCEQCGSNNLQQVFGGFAILGGQTVNMKSNNSGNNSGGCCGGSGNGCC